MKLSDVIEFVQYFMNFKLFEINKTAITPSSIFMFAVFIAVFAVTSRLLQRMLRAQVFSRLGVDEGMQYTLTRITHYLIMIIGAVVAFSIHRHRSHRLGDHRRLFVRRHRFWIAKYHVQLRCRPDPAP